MLREAFKKRLFNLIILFFVLAAVFIAIYFYISASTKVNAIRALVDVIRQSADIGLINSINTNLSGVMLLVVSQLVVFIVAVVSLAFGTWFISSLYFVEKRNSLIDPLTEIYNRRAVLFGLEKEIRRASRTGKPVSVAGLDIDYFKKYNDANGHIAGDRLLRRFARILTKQTRSYDIVGRIGGEEFLIVLPLADLKKAAEICERIRRVVDETRFAGEKNLEHKNVTASIGLAEFSTKKGKKVKKEILIGRADARLYKAKGLGRNVLVIK